MLLGTLCSRAFSVALLFVAAAASSGCTTGDGSASSSSGASGSSGATDVEAPILESVEAPVSLSAENGAYNLSMDLAYRDPQGDAVTKVRFRIPAGDLDKTQAIEESGPAVTRATVTVSIGANVPPMTYAYFVSVIDAQGNESAPISKEISLN